MRTTLNLDDDVGEQLMQHAKSRGVSIGKMASDLIRRGLHSPAPIESRNGLTVFKLSADSPEVTTAIVRRIEEEGA